MSISFVTKRLKINVCLFLLFFERVYYMRKLLFGTQTLLSIYFVCILYCHPSNNTN